MNNGVAIRISISRVPIDLTRNWQVMTHEVHSIKFLAGDGFVCIYTRLRPLLQSHDSKVQPENATSRGARETRRQTYSILTSGIENETGTCMLPNYSLRLSDSLAKLRHSNAKTSPHTHSTNTRNFVSAWKFSSILVRSFSLLCSLSLTVNSFDGWITSLHKLHFLQNVSLSRRVVVHIGQGTANRIVTDFDNSDTTNRRRFLSSAGRSETMKNSQCEKFSSFSTVTANPFFDSIITHDNYNSIGKARVNRKRILNDLMTFVSGISLVQLIFI